VTHRLQICGSICLTACLRRVPENLRTFQGEMRQRLLAVNMSEVIFMQPVTYLFTFRTMNRCFITYSEMCFCAFLPVPHFASQLIIFAYQRCGDAEKLFLTSDSVNDWFRKLVMLLLRCGKCKMVNNYDRYSTVGEFRK
jgi:hypothetical protein